VDDELPVLQVLDRTLADAGYSVLTAESGLQALYLIRSVTETVDVVITDVAMPGIGGKGPRCPAPGALTCGASDFHDWICFTADARRAARPHIRQAD
jgi:hypothetical protein